MVCVPAVSERYLDHPGPPAPAPPRQGRQGGPDGEATQAEGAVCVAPGVQLEVEVVAKPGGERRGGGDQQQQQQQQQQRHGVAGRGVAGPPPAIPADCGAVTNSLTRSLRHDSVDTGVADKNF